MVYVKETTIREQITSKVTNGSQTQREYPTAGGGHQLGPKKLYTCLVKMDVTLNKATHIIELKQNKYKTNRGQRRLTFSFNADTTATSLKINFII